MTDNRVVCLVRQSTLMVLRDLFSDLNIAENDLDGNLMALVHRYNKPLDKLPAIGPGRVNISISGNTANALYYAFFRMYPGKPWPGWNKALRYFLENQIFSLD